MSKPVRFRPKASHFKSRADRDRHFRELGRRTDRKARRDRKLMELDDGYSEAALHATQSPCQASPCDSERDA